MDVKLFISLMSGIFVIFLFIYFLLTLNFWINVEDVCSKDCHDDYKRKVILFLILAIPIFIITNQLYLKLSDFNYIIALLLLSTISNILQFLYLRQLKNECKCDKSFIMDMIRILNYFALFILLPSNYVSIFLLKKSGKM